MDRKIIFLLIALIGISHAQVAPPSASCSYSVSGTAYFCFLTISNPEGLDTITTVSGQHVEGRTDADVTYLVRSSGVTANIPSVLCSQFPNLIYFDLTNAGIQQVAENAIAGCPSLQSFRIWINQVAELPENFFANNANLSYIDIDNNRLTTLHENLFVPLVNLQTLEIRNNPFDSIPGNVFRAQQNLMVLIMDNVRISEINPDWFAPLTQLFYLNIGRNLFTTITAESFATLTQLSSLAFYGNSLLETIPGNAFTLLTRLRYLDLSSNRIVEFNPEWIAPMASTLTELDLAFNRIEDPPEGAFAAIENIVYLSLWANRVKTVRRNYFGNISNLNVLDLDENVINALERSVFEESAESLQVLYFWNNVCASGSFFELNRNWEQGMQRLQGCFRNFEFSVETTTEGGDDYRFYRYPEPGLVLRVIAPERVHISLNPVEFEAVPRVEILLGENNNTRSMIRINGDENVVDISTPGILNANIWSGFRVAFANWAVLVFREGDQFPFMVYNMQQFYPINFYGIRTPGNVVPWSIQPLDAENRPVPIAIDNLTKKKVMPSAYEKPMMI